MLNKKLSIKKNYIYNIFLNTSNLIFPLITLPYVYRVLSVESIGSIEFSLSIIQYFILFSQVGIPIYGIRECARYKDDINKMVKTAQEIMIINLILSAISYLILFVAIGVINEFNNYKTIMFLFSLNIIFINIGMEWFFQAIEKYKYITIRNIVIKVISVFLIFLLLNHESDYLIYAMILVITNALNGIINFIIISKNYKILKRRKGKYFYKRHLKSIIILSGISISIVIYTNVDKTMLGLLSGNTSVGLYAVSYKINIVILSIITSLGVVLLPRLSYYIKNNLTKESSKLISYAFDIVPLIAIPSVVGIIVLAEDIIFIMAGDNYYEAVSTLKILSPIILINGLANLTGIILFSYGKERITLIATFFGASINIIFNFVLIPYLSHNGAAIATVIAEIFVLVIQYYYISKVFKFRLNYKNLFEYFLGSMIIVLTCLTISDLVPNIVFRILISILLSLVGYIIFLLLIKNKVIHDLIVSKILKR